jgi:bifunctional non-homologous end joining protein LigD
VTSDPLPRSLVPMMATAGALPPDEEAWSFEVKWDGVRALSYIEDGVITMESRNLKDITPRYPEVHPLAEQLGGRSAILDGEVVAFDDAGRPSFSRLQNRMHLAGERHVAARMVDTPVVYLLFDVLHLDGRSTMDLPYTERRELLESLQLAGGCWQTPGAHPGAGTLLLEASKAQGLEGVMAKRLTSTYAPGRRSREWLKVKNVCRQEVVIGGWLPGEGNRTGRIGALLAGYYEDDGTTLRFAGKVGTGYTSKELDRLAGLLEPLARPTSPFADKVPYRASRFVEPVLVAEVEFTEWTHTGTLRHPSYKGTRDDKAAHDVRRE